MRVRRRMTAAEFEAIRTNYTMSDERREAARACLVDGRTLQAVADVYGWTRQSVNDAVTKVWKAWMRHQESQKAIENAGTLLPPGWEQVTLIAPSYLISKFRSEIAEVSSAFVQSKQSKSKVKRK